MMQPATRADLRQRWDDSGVARAFLSVAAIPGQEGGGQWGTAPWAAGYRRGSPVASRYTDGSIITLTRPTMTMPDAMVTTDMICQNCAHFAAFRGEREGWEARLGACRHWQGRIQHAESQPHRFGCGAWMPAASPSA